MYAIVLDGNDKVINVVKHSKGQKASASVIALDSGRCHRCNP